MKEREGETRESKAIRISVEAKKGWGKKEYELLTNS